MISWNHEFHSNLHSVFYSNSNSTNHNYQFGIIVLVCEDVISISHMVVFCANKLNVEGN